jgi:hypothetical protein
MPKTIVLADGEEMGVYPEEGGGLHPIHDYGRWED